MLCCNNWTTVPKICDPAVVLAALCCPRQAAAILQKLLQLLHSKNAAVSHGEGLFPASFSDTQKFSWCSMLNNKLL